MGLLFLAQHLRYVERELSSRQLITWLTWITGVTMFLTWTIQQTILGVAAESSFSFASGPYPWIGGILYWYIRYVPRLYPRFVSLLGGIALSEKALSYMWAVYIMASQGWASVRPGVLGFVAAALYFAVVQTHLPWFTLPEVVVQLLPWESLGGLVFLDPPPKVYVPLLAQAQTPIWNATAEGGGGRARPPRPAATPPPPRPTPPSQEAIDQLTAMGFDEERVRQALQHTNNNVERAADRLLTG